MSFFPDAPRITAVLGPTNTGKTFLALDRMLGYASGMIGFPLRLLARENYDKIVRLKGAARVALITGEERIIPPHPSWFVCTVESMPLNRTVEFLAVDEIQLCADPDRGHIFTDRLLHARGRSETMFLGAETIRPLIQQLVPGVEVVTRPRFSTLSYAGSQKLTRLPRRSAIVAFSAQDVYSIAELIRRTRGGAAVVLGALSPRTRNAQVALFQGGEVEHLVATDAIGMGLNMDIDHVAFASLRKFDGRVPRDLQASEVAQIAGRAGRHMNNGTFGTTCDSGIMDPGVVDLVENHQFPPLRGIFWRNRDLKMTSLEALLASLSRGPETPGLLRQRPADDQLVLEALARDADIAGLARGHGRLKLLWEVCQIPDFRKVKAEGHARLLSQIYHFLTSPQGTLPVDWVRGHLSVLDRADGDMHVLMERIASIRVWTYISHRAGWLAGAMEWQEKARAIEDMLSDALHQRLTQRFVDVRTSVLSRRLRQGGAMLAAVSASDAVTVEGQHVGHLSGLTFIPDATDGPSASRAVLNAASRALRGEIARRVSLLADSEDQRFRLGPGGDIFWDNARVAGLVAGPHLLRPQLDIPSDEMLEGAGRETVRQRLGRWLALALEEGLSPLDRASDPALTPVVRGILFTLREQGGCVPLADVRTSLSLASEADRATLARLGVRFGRDFAFVPRLFKPAARQFRLTLWAVFNRCAPPAPDVRRQVLPVTDLPETLAALLGFRRLGNLLVQVDAAEKLAVVLRQQGRLERPVVSPSVVGMIGIPSREASGVIAALGWQVEEVEDGLLLQRKSRASSGSPARAPASRPPASRSPASRPPSPRLASQPVPVAEPQAAEAPAEAPAEDAGEQQAGKQRQKQQQTPRQKQRQAIRGDHPDGHPGEQPGQQEDKTRGTRRKGREQLPSGSTALVGEARATGGRGREQLQGAIPAEEPSSDPSSRKPSSSRKQSPSRGNVAARQTVPADSPFAVLQGMTFAPAPNAVPASGRAAKAGATKGNTSGKGIASQRQTTVAVRPQPAPVPAAVLARALASAWGATASGVPARTDDAVNSGGKGASSHSRRQVSPVGPFSGDPAASGRPEASDPSPADQSPVILPPVVLSIPASGPVTGLVTGGHPVPGTSARNAVRKPGAGAERQAGAAGKDSLPAPSAPVSSATRMRLDKWLWYARFVKSRSLAQGLCEQGKVSLNGGRVRKPAAMVRAGDTLTLVVGGQRRFLSVVALGERRGPAPEARLLYTETRPAEKLGGFRAEWTAGEEDPGE